MMKNTPNFKELKALYINCTLKKSPGESHTEGLMHVSESIMSEENVDVEHIRLVDHQIAYGVQPDMAKDDTVERDDWPQIAEKVKNADILVIGTPIWLGEKSSIASLLIERLYALSGMRNDKGQSLFYGKVGGCAITGNEDGVKHCAMGILYALQHVGFSIPPQADCGWIGNIGPGPSYKDKESGAAEHEFTNKNTTIMSYNLLHLAKMLKDNGGYDNYGNDRDAWEDGSRWAFSNPAYR